MLRGLGELAFAHVGAQSGRTDEEEVRERLREARCAQLVERAEKVWERGERPAQGEERSHGHLRLEVAGEVRVAACQTRFRLGILDGAGNAHTDGANAQCNQREERRSRKASKEECLGGWAASYQAEGESHKAPLVVRLLARMGSRRAALLCMASQASALL